MLQRHLKKQPNIRENIRQTEYNEEEEKGNENHVGGHVGFEKICKYRSCKAGLMEGILNLWDKVL